MEGFEFGESSQGSSYFIEIMSGKLIVFRYSQVDLLDLWRKKVLEIQDNLACWMSISMEAKSVFFEIFQIFQIFMNIRFEERGNMGLL